MSNQFAKIIKGALRLSSQKTSIQIEVTRSRIEEALKATSSNYFTIQADKFVSEKDPFALNPNGWNEVVETMKKVPQMGDAAGENTSAGRVRGKVIELTQHGHSEVAEAEMLAKSIIENSLTPEQVQRVVEITTLNLTQPKAQDAKVEAPVHNEPEADQTEFNFEN